MLRKIENISSSADLKNNSRFSSDVGNVSGIVHRKNTASDSFSSSNAFKFLASLKWNLKSLRKKDKEEFEVEFVIDDYEFHTTINMLDIYSKYTLYKIFSFNYTEMKSPFYEIWLKFIFNTNNVQDKNEYYRIEFLQLVTNRIKKNPGLFIGDTENEANSILDGIDSQLNSELCFIHNNLLRFLEKATGESLLNNGQNPELPTSHPLIVEYLNVNY